MLYDRPGKRFEKILYSKCTHRTHSLILSGDMGMLEYGFDHYKLENPVVCRGKIEALGEALLYGDETKRTGN